MEQIGKVLSIAAVFFGLLAGATAEAVPADFIAPQETSLKSVIRKYSDCEGIDVVTLGKIGTSLLKNLVRVSMMDEIRDPDARAILSLIRDIKGVTIMDYDDAPRHVRNAINAEIGAIFSQRDNLLMEIKDDGEDMYIFSETDRGGSEFRDIVLYTPSDGAIIWIKGRVSTEAIAKLARD